MAMVQGGLPALVSGEHAHHSRRITWQTIKMAVHVQLAQWGTSMGLEDAMQAVLADDFNP